MNLSGISAVIPTYNGKELLTKSLPLLILALKNQPLEWEVIVADDASTDGTVRFLNKEFPEVRWVKSERNKGFASTCNLGFQKAKYDVILLLNSDTLVTKDFIPPLLEHFKNDQLFGVHPKGLDWDEETFRDGGKVGSFTRGFFRFTKNYDVGEKRTPGELLSFFATGAFSALDRKKVLELGGFDELFSPFNVEDIELSYRAWKRGWEIHYEPKSIVYHRPNTTINKYYKRFKVRCIYQRNRFFFVWKNVFDPKMILSHFLFLLIPSLRVDKYIGLFMAFEKLPKIWQNRKKEKKNVRRTDKEIMESLRQFYSKIETT